MVFIGNRFIIGICYCKYIAPIIIFILCYHITSDNTYTLEAYRVNGGATTDYSIKVYRIDNDSSKSLIYNKYHDYNAEIKWISNYTVSINDVTIDLSKNETYDWRNK